MTVEGATLKKEKNGKIMNEVMFLCMFGYFYQTYDPMSSVLVLSEIL